MREEKIVAVIKRVGKEGEIVTVNNELEDFQEIVKGYMEIYPLRNDILIICNEEGKLMNLPVNFGIPCRDNYTEYMVGDVVIVSNNGDEFGSLNEEQISFLKSIGLC